MLLIVRRTSREATEKKGPPWWAPWQRGELMLPLGIRTKSSLWQPSYWPNLRRMHQCSPQAYEDR